VNGYVPGYLYVSFKEACEPNPFPMHPNSSITLAEYAIAGPADSVNFNRDKHINAQAEQHQIHGC